MRSVYEQRVGDANEIERSVLQGAATICIPWFGRACKGMWPAKTAEELAALVGISVRAAAYQISGEQEPTARTIQAVVNLWLPRR
jgi:hypothetical protein